MLEHISLPVSDYKKSRDFYRAALAPLGYELTQEYEPEAAGYKEGEHTSFWIARKSGITPGHVAFRAKGKDEVQRFYDEALKAGGRDNGGPGFRTDYGDNYYAAFVYDPDGNNIEACYFGEKASGEKASEENK